MQSFLSKAVDGFHSDLPPWPALHDLDEIPYNGLVQAPLERHAANLRFFCNNLSCVTSHCATHCTSISVIDVSLSVSQFVTVETSPAVQIEDAIVGQTSNKALLEAAGKPCGPTCFRSKEQYELVSQFPHITTFCHHLPKVEWKPSEVELLKLTMDLGPTMTPCELAEMCCRPCREVWS